MFFYIIVILNEIAVEPLIFCLYQRKGFKKTNCYFLCSTMKSLCFVRLFEFIILM